jgi:hypothetical protein
MVAATSSSRRATRGSLPRRIPRARLTLYGAAGHAFLFQRRADFATRVNSFLE